MKTVLCYGDSNTWGYVPETDGRLLWEQRWPGILQRKLGTSYRVIENGICGRTTKFDSCQEKFVNGYTGAQECAVMNEPLDIVIVMLGTNDCKDIYESEPEEIAKGVEKIGRIFSKTGADIWILSPPPLRDMYSSPFCDEFGSRAEEKSKSLAVTLEKMAYLNNWKFIDAASTVEAGEFDGIHMSKESHRKLAFEVAEKIKKTEGEYGKCKTATGIGKK